MKIRNLKILVKAIVYVLAAPILILWYLIRGIKRLGALQYIFATSVHCSNCRNQVSLVGIWKCRCGYTYRGHVLRKCALCGRMASLVRCNQCQVTLNLI